MDPPPKHFQSPKSHVLDTKGVLYSSFWLAGPKKTPKLDNIVSKIVPRDLEERRTWNLEGWRRDLEGRVAQIVAAWQWRENAEMERDSPSIFSLFPPTIVTNITKKLNIYAM